MNCGDIYIYIYIYREREREREKYEDIYLIMQGIERDFELDKN
jgi:hypothetical protein